MPFALTEQLLDSPNVYLIMQEVQAILNEERAKREAFYNDITEEFKWEFINGEVILHSPVMLRHNDATGLLYQLMKVHVQKHKLGFVGIEKIMTALTRNDYEPDICYFNQEKAATFTPKQTLFPAPDLAVEVLSDSTEKRDRGIKFTDYQAHGVLEYWLVDADEATIEQYRLIDGHYELILKAGEGTIHSVALSGFSIPIAAAFDEEVNLSAMMAILST